MKILFTTDGSNYSELAAKFLKTLHLTDDAKVVLATVVTPYAPVGYTDLPPSTLTLIEEVQKDYLGAAYKILDKAQSQIVNECPVELIKQAYVGHPAEEIVKAATEFDVDLVVTGSAGRTGLEGLFLGGVSQKVLRYAKKSVLIVKKSFEKLDKILFATDGSAYAHKALLWMVNSKLPPAAKVHVISVAPHPEDILMQESFENKEKLDFIHKIHKEAAEKVVNHAKKELKKHFSKVDGEVLTGDPANEIIIASKEGQYDLLVLGAKGLSAVDEFLLGTVTRKAAKMTSSSVLVVK